MVARVIGPDGGELTSPGGATVIIPAGALTEDATVTIIPVGDTKLPVSEEVDFVPGKAFDVNVAGATGDSVERLLKPATLRIGLEPEQWRDGIMLYAINGLAVEPIPSSTLTEDAVDAEVEHFSTYAAGLPAATDPTGREPLPFILGALGVIVVLLAVVTFVTAHQRRRPATITPRRRRYH
jgi:hypothetical protein